MAKRKKKRVVWCLYNTKEDYILNEHYDSREDARIYKRIDLYKDMKEFRIIKFIEA